MVMQRVTKNDDPFATIAGLGTRHWRVEIWTVQYGYTPTHDRTFRRKAAAERWANKMLVKEQRRAAHEHQQVLVTLCK